MTSIADFARLMVRSVHIGAVSCVKIGRAHWLEAEMEKPDELLTTRGSAAAFSSCAVRARFLIGDGSFAASG
jgi:hypothetical protein